MRVNEGKLASVMICNPRQIFGGLWSFSSIVFYISLYLSPKSSQCNTNPISCEFVVCWAMKRDRPVTV